ncbi:hypothetical protein PR202_ga02965 [Eleusine coracana subsp. coracana]|uniref:Uncharacterized protein n=1 Tax=Eleusine coracana subsp. coracana TaxID=191504 RepID=A0AAV5BN78_ELECO|nr:hypothetical protein PR202_ga02965 [Eleusine coracana subsp. coracana]
MTVTSLPPFFFPKLRNLLNPFGVSFGDRAVPAETLLRALPGVFSALFSARCFSRFFRRSAASASSTLSMDWSRELHDGAALLGGDRPNLPLPEKEDSPELSLAAGASSAAFLVVAIISVAAAPLVPSLFRHHLRWSSSN